MCIRLNFSHQGYLRARFSGAVCDPYEVHTTTWEDNERYLLPQGLCDKGNDSMAHIAMIFPGETFGLNGRHLRVSTIEVACQDME